MNRIAIAVLLALAWRAEAVAVPIQLEQPAAGTTLIGGSTAVLSWSPTGPMNPAFEEWEAFLSLDGGRYYFARITPHLDASIRRFTWVVPNVESRQARLLLRFGNEHDEEVAEIPFAVAIVSSFRLGAVPMPRGSAGEAARPGDAGVVQWVEGDRGGRQARLLYSESPTLDVRLPVAVSEAASTLAPGLLDLAFTLGDGVPLRERSRTSRTLSLVRPTPPLLQSCRLNI